MNKMKMWMAGLVLILGLGAAAFQPAAGQDFKAGDVLTFGSYEQDNNLSNGAEPISWLVLKADGYVTEMIAQNGLDSQPFHNEYVPITWKDCSLRTWLNTEFYNSAFTDLEKAAMLNVSINETDQAAVSQNTADDHVFLLNQDEAGSLFADDAARQMEATPYAKARGVYTWADNGKSYWWLRGNMYYEKYAAGVNYDGVIPWSYTNETYTENAVRPVIFVDWSKVAG